MGIFIFILGLLIGSFLNVCIYRVPKGESVAFPPSHCTSCSTKIKSYDLIPVISYIFLGGKCRGCGEKISIRYPVLELFTGIMFYLTYIQYGLTLNTLKFIILISILIVTAMIDFDTHYTYSYITYSGIAIGVIFMLIEKFYLNQAITTYLIGLGIGVLVIGAIVFLTRGMGEGDIEIAALCGIFIGWQNTLAMLLLSFVLGALYGVTLIIFRQKSRKDEIAFGPFLAMGSIIAIFWGNRLISIYSGLFF